MFDLGGAEEAAETMSPKLPDIASFSKDISLAMEKELLGVYITDHPLKDYADKMEAVATITSEELNHAGEEAEIGEHTDIKDGMKAVMAGMVTSKKNAYN